MKRILIISYNFAPRQSIGSIRPTKLAKYLAKAGNTVEEADAKLAEWYASKQEKDFAKADEVRNYLSAKGINVSDRGGMPEWDVVFKK